MIKSLVVFVGTLTACTFAHIIKQNKNNKNVVDCKFISNEIKTILR